MNHLCFAGAGGVSECAVLVARPPSTPTPLGLRARVRQGSAAFFPSKIKICLGARISASGGSLAKQFCRLMPHPNFGGIQRKF